MIRCAGWTVTSSGCSDAVGWRDGQAPSPTPKATFVAAAAGDASHRTRTGRPRLRRSRHRGDPGHQDLPVPRLRSGDKAGNRARGGVAVRCWGVLRGRPAPLAHAMLEQPREPSANQEVVLARDSPVGGSHSPLSPPDVDIVFGRILSARCLPARRVRSARHRCPSGG